MQQNIYYKSLQHTTMTYKEKKNTEALASLSRGDTCGASASTTRTPPPRPSSQPESPCTSCGYWRRRSHLHPPLGFPRASSTLARCAIAKH